MSITIRLLFFKDHKKYQNNFFFYKHYERRLISVNICKNCIFHIFWKTFLLNKTLIPVNIRKNCILNISAVK